MHTYVALCSVLPWHTGLLFFSISFFSQPSWMFLSFTFLPMLFICNNPMYLYEHGGTTAGRLLITLSNNLAPPTVSSPRGSPPLLMETNSSSARGRGVSKHPLSSYEKTLAQYRNPSKTQFEWVQKKAIIYVCESTSECCPIWPTQTFTLWIFPDRSLRIFSLFWLPEDWITHFVIKAQYHKKDYTKIFKTKRNH